MFKIAGIAIAIILLAAGGAYLYQTGMLNLNSTVPTQAPVAQINNSTPAPTKPTENLLEVEDQEGGMTVAIKRVNLLSKGYVVIHAPTKDGKPGEVIGHTELMDAGEEMDLDIEVDEELGKGDVVFAMLHGDNGDGDYTTLDEDEPIKDAAGNVVTKKITITSNVETEE